MIKYILETLNVEEDTETLNMEDDTETLIIYDDIETLDKVKGDNIKTLVSI